MRIFAYIESQVMWKFAIRVHMHTKNLMHWCLREWNAPWVHRRPCTGCSGSSACCLTGMSASSP